MTQPFLLTEPQMRRISPHFPLSHGKPRVDDQRVISGIIYVIRNGLMWRDAPVSYGPYKTIYNRFIRWSRTGVFARMLIELTNQAGDTDEIMIGATHLKAHRTAASLVKLEATTIQGIVLLNNGFFRVLGKMIPRDETARSSNSHRSNHGCSKVDSKLSDISRQ